MIVIDKDNKNLVIPNGLGNINRDYQEGYEAGYQESFDEGKAEGLAEGRAEGLAEGKTIGIAEGKQIQKDLLEAITITENGTYNKEDGYNEIIVEVPDVNGSYDEGYQAGIDYASENANEIAAANAIVLDVTENKTYYTKYVDIPEPEIITGEYPNGEKFYNYANLTDIVYDTGIQVTPYTRFELWWKQDKADDNYSTIIGAQGGQIMKLAEYNGRYVAEYGGGAYYFDIPPGWNHIIFSKADGVVVNGVQAVELSDATGENYPDVIYINASYLGEKDYNANGSFGMIKINDTIIIPTPVGFLNTNTNEMLSVAYTADGGGYFYENQDIIPIDNLIKQVNVNVKINVKESGIKFAYSTFTEVPEFYDFSNLFNAESLFRSCSNLTTISLIDTSNVTNMSYMFANCGNLITIPLIDTSNVTNMSNMFANCNKLQTIPQLDTSYVTDMTYMFSDCSNLTTISSIDTSNVTGMYRMFYRCSKLQTIPELDTSNVTGMNYMFYEATNLISLPALNATKLTSINYYFGTTNLENLTNVGGWINLNINWNDDRGLVKCPNLTYQSCINILNGLADVTELGGRTLKVHQNFLNLVGDEISIGINKGWTITA